MKRLSNTLCVLTALAVSEVMAAPDLSWLHGAWCGATGAVQEEEVWLAPRGNLMLGMHRDIKGDRTIGFEFLRIELHTDGATYVAQPGGQPPVRFEMQQNSTRAASFVNMKHDFPKRIHYERSDANTLTARIDDGTDSGKSMRWTWRPCPPAAKL
jgi:hypothetical protein